MIFHEFSLRKYVVALWKLRLWLFIHKIIITAIMFNFDNTIILLKVSNSLAPYMYSKTCVKRTLSKRPKIGVFKINYRLMQVESFAECSKRSILQYFRPSLSYHLSLRSLFCLFLSGRLHRFYCTLPSDTGY